MLSVKIRLKPTKTQEVYFKKASGTARWSYNYALERSETFYKETGKRISEQDIRKEITQLKKQEEFKWLQEISAQVPKQAVKDLDLAYKRFFKGLGNKPKFKSKKNSKLSFYIPNDKLRVEENRVYLDKLGWVKTNKDTRGTHLLSKFSNPRVKFDGKYWFLTFSVDKLPNKNYSEGNLNKEVMGIDLGISKLAYLSNGKYYLNINKTRIVRKLEKRLKRLQRQVSRKYRMNKQGNKFIKTKNIIKLEAKIKLLYRRLSNIRLDYLHKVTTEIVRTKPSQIVLEDLKVRNLLKNKHLSKAIKDQSLSKFREFITYKAKLQGIEIKLANTFYPSSKICSSCNFKLNSLKLHDRVFKCPECGLEIDRDLNAAINLAQLI